MILSYKEGPVKFCKGCGRFMPLKNMGGLIQKDKSKDRRFIPHKLLLKDEYCLNSILDNESEFDYQINDFTFIETKENEEYFVLTNRKIVSYIIHRQKVHPRYWICINMNGEEIKRDKYRINLFESLS